MRIASTELRQVFRAYTKQLRSEHTNSDKQSRANRSRGYEKVSISEEAKELAAQRTQRAEAEENRPDETDSEQNPEQEQGQDQST